MPRTAIKSQPDSAEIFRARLLSWYRTQGRAHLPWRNTADPYAIYISEIMLQQTQVETVLSRFYFPFLTRFPTLQALAAASREEVLKSWQGLGYYTRAANLHKAAQAAGGALPDHVEGLLALPGIGRNTAHAVAAFGFRRPVAVMEANVKRVLSRIYALRSSSEALAQKTLWEKAEALLDPAEPFDYNQAMMDLGAMICTRTKPKCGECPANHFCAGQANPLAYPAPKLAKTERVRRKVIIVRQDARGRFHATPRTSRFLQGMYQFEEIDVPQCHREAEGRGGPVARELDCFADARNDAIHLGHIRQVYSHFTLEAEVYLLPSSPRMRGSQASPVPPEIPAQGGDDGWHTLEELQRLPHSKAEEKIITLLAAV